MTKAERSDGDTPMHQYASDIAITPAVKAIQSRKGSRSLYLKDEKGRGWQTKVTPELKVFLSELACSIWAQRTPKGNRTFNTGADHRGSLKPWTTRRWVLPTSWAANSTSPWATSPKTQRRLFFLWTTPTADVSNFGVAPMRSRLIQRCSTSFVIRPIRLRWNEQSYLR